MVVQAGAARTVVERDPASRGRRRSGRWRRPAAIGLAEMRRLIGVLKATTTDAALAPQPGLDGLDALLDTMRAAGVPVEAMADGDAARTAARGRPHRVPGRPGGADERPAPRGAVAHASVTLRYAPDGVEVQVADDGRGPIATGDGRGHGSRRDARTRRAVRRHARDRARVRRRVRGARLAPRGPRCPRDVRVLDRRRPGADARRLPDDRRRRGRPRGGRRGDRRRGRRAPVRGAARPTSS